MTQPTETRLYKILNASDWVTASTLRYTKTTLDEGDGYVHLSSRDQVAETLALHYRHQTGIHLLEYTAEQFGDEMRWEESRGGALFPHLYAVLRLDAAKRLWTLENGPDGNHILPNDIDQWP